MLRPKTIAEREIQLVKGLVAISQALKKKESGGEKKGKGGIFMAFLFIYFAFLLRRFPLPSFPPAAAWICLFKKLFRVHICHIYLTRAG